MTNTRPFYIGTDGVPVPIQEPLTKREYFAFEILKKYISNPYAVEKNSRYTIAYEAVSQADHFMSELNKSGVNNE